MARFTLIIGSKNYSSWSLRAWIGARHAGIDFDEVVIPLDQTATRGRILSYSPAGLVPILKDGGATIWESLAILEYLAEVAPEKNLWPADAAARAHARTVSAGMHAGFMALRQACPMNCRKRYEAFDMTPEARADTDRIANLWQDCRERFGRGGDFLFGGFTNADAMFAPVVSRFVTYGVPLDPVNQAYVDAVMALPSMHEWYAAAASEPVIDKHEF